jgi:hypothetical protein
VSTPALEAAGAAGLSHRVIRHGPVRSLAEAARARGVAPADVVKTLVVRRGEDDFLFAPGLSLGEARPARAGPTLRAALISPAHSAARPVLGVAVSLGGPLSIVPLAATASRRPPTGVACDGFASLGRDSRLVGGGQAQHCAGYRGRLADPRLECPQPDGHVGLGVVAGEINVTDHKDHPRPDDL